METICNNCGSKNKSTNIKCEYCGSVLNEEVIDLQINDYIEEEPKKMTEEQIKASKKSLKVFFIIFLIMFLVPFIVIGFVFSSFFSTFSKMQDEISNGYYQVQGALTGYTDIQSNGTYKGIYEYEVNGKTYTVTTNYASNVDIFDDYVTVKYNPENPENAIVDMESDLTSFGIIGFSAFSFVIVILVVIFIIIAVSFIIKKSKSNDTKSDVIKSV